MRAACDAVGSSVWSSNHVKRTPPAVYSSQIFLTSSTCQLFARKAALAAARVTPMSTSDTIRCSRLSLGMAAILLSLFEDWLWYLCVVEQTQTRLVAVSPKEVAIAFGLQSVILSLRETNCEQGGSLLGVKRSLTYYCRHTNWLTTNIRVVKRNLYGLPS